MNLHARVQKLEKTQGEQSPLCFSIEADNQAEYDARYLDLMLSGQCIVGRRHSITAAVAGVADRHDFLLLAHEDALEHLQ
jgi:hypothetical protein